MTQTNSEVFAEMFEDLEHHGTKGMHWGQRKQKSNVKTTSVDARMSPNTGGKTGLKRHDGRQLARVLGQTNYGTVGSMAAQSLMRGISDHHNKKIIEKTLGMSTKNMDKKSLKSTLDVMDKYNSVQLRTTGGSWKSTPQKKKKTT